MARATSRLARRVALAPLVLAELPLRRRRAATPAACTKRACARASRLDARVVSIGNLAVGGSAKTPRGRVPRARAARARRARRAALARRGRQRARARAERRLGRRADPARAPPRSATSRCLLAASAPGVPVLAGVDRAALGLRAISALRRDACSLLDDGFQHHRLARDLDLVCLDARLGLGNGHVLPRGPLREPVSALARAHALVFTRAAPDDAAPPGARAAARATCHSSVSRIAQARPAPARRRRARAARAPARRARRPARRDRAARPTRARARRARRARSSRGASSATTTATGARTSPASIPALRWVTTAKDAVKIDAAWDGARRVLACSRKRSSPRAAPRSRASSPRGSASSSGQEERGSAPLPGDEAEQEQRDRRADRGFGVPSTCV